MENLDKELNLALGKLLETYKKIDILQTLNHQMLLKKMEIAEAKNKIEQIRHSIIYFKVLDFDR